MLNRLTALQIICWARCKVASLVQIDFFAIGSFIVLLCDIVLIANADKQFQFTVLQDLTLSQSPIIILTTLVPKVPTLLLTF